jgi:hypothetical protein
MAWKVQIAIRSEIELCDRAMPTCWLMERMSVVLAYEFELSTERGLLTWTSGIVILILRSGYHLEDIGRWERCRCTGRGE